MIRLFKEMIILFLAAFAAVYLMFPTLGIFEFIPDAIPIIGSIDEATATLIILNTLNYYGLNLTNLYGSAHKRKLQAPQQIVYVERPREQK